MLPDASAPEPRAARTSNPTCPNRRAAPTAPTQQTASTAPTTSNPPAALTASTPTGRTGPRRLRTLVVIGLLAAVAVCSACEVIDPGPRDTIGSIAVAATTPTVTNVAYGPEAAQRLDLYLPSRSSGSAPLIVFIHGGGWNAGDRTVVPAPIRHEVDRGWAVASIDYRLVPDVSWPTPVGDVKLAVRFLKSKAATYHLRPDRVVLAGVSAGGYLALFAGTTPSGSYEPSVPVDLAGFSSSVDGIIDWVGPTDLTSLATVPPTLGVTPSVMVGNFLGCPASGGAALAGCPPDLIADAEIAPHLDRSDPPMYLAYGTADPLVPVSQSDVLMASAKAQRTKDDVWRDKVDGASHFVDGGVNVVQQDAWIDKVLQQSF